MTHDELVTLLQTSKLVTVNFLKRDGTPRTMFCTLHEDIIPPSTGSSVPREGQITAWDLDKEAWRTINTDTRFTAV
jgi:hypothetical protein